VRFKSSGGRREHALLDLRAFGSQVEDLCSFMDELCGKQLTVTGYRRWAWREVGDREVRINAVFLPDNRNEVANGNLFVKFVDRLQP